MGSNRRSGFHTEQSLGSRETCGMETAPTGDVIVDLFIDTPYSEQSDRGQSG